MRKVLAGLIAGFVFMTNPFSVASATILTSTAAADNLYDIYISINDVSQGIHLGTGNPSLDDGWKYPRTYSSEELIAGVDYYIHVKARNTGANAGFLGQFSLDDATDHIFTNGTGTLYTTTGDWKGNDTGWGAPYIDLTSNGKRGVDPWFSQGDLTQISTDAHWIWAGTEVGSTYLSTKISAENPLTPVFITNNHGIGKDDQLVGGDWYAYSPEPTDENIKKTFLDLSQATPILTLTSDPVTAINLDFTGATADTNQYVSGRLYGAGLAEYYAKFADTSSIGNGSFSVPTSISGDGVYSFDIFCEQANPKDYHDFMGKPVMFELTVDSGSVTDMTLLSTDIDFGLDGGTIGLKAGLDYTQDFTLGSTESGSVNAFKTPGDSEISGNLTGSGGMTKTGTGTLILSGSNNDYIGATTVSEGILKGNISLGTNLEVKSGATYEASGSDRTVGALTGSGTVAMGGNGLTVSSGNFSGDISGTGTKLTKISGDTLTLSGPNTYTGGTTVSGGTLVGDSGSLQGDIENNAAVSFNQAGAGTYSGNMSGTGSLTKEGAGDLTLSGTNNYAGGTTVSGGTLVGDTDSLQGNILNNAAVKFDEAGDGTYSGNMSGTGSLIKEGAGDLTLSGTNNYAGGTTVSGGTLIGDTDSLQGDIVNNAAVNFDQAGAGTYSGNMSGAGSLIKEGAGGLTLSGTNNYAGGTTIADGILTAANKDALGTGDIETQVNGTLVLDFEGEFANNLTGLGTVEIAGNGVAITNPASLAISVSGTLVGTSTYKSIHVKSGGTISPGNGTIGTIGTINTDSLSFEAGAFFDVEVNPLDTSDSDFVQVTNNAALNGATVRHIGLSESMGQYPSEGEWLILSAGTITGSFAEDVDTTLFPFLSGALRYDGTDVYLTLARTADFTDFAVTFNEMNVATGLGSLDSSNPLYTAVTQTAGDINAIRSAYNQLSGEFFPGLSGTISQIGQQFGHQMLARFGNGLADVSTSSSVAAGALTENTEFWVSVDGYKNTVDRTSNTAKSEFKGWGASLGVEKEVEDWRFGAAFRYGDGEYKVKSLHSKADLDSFNFGVYAGRPLGDFNVKFGAGYGFHQVDSNRRVAFMGENLKADYDAHSFQLFGELGYLKDFGSFSMEPYLGLAWNYTENESFTEKGGTSALRAKSESNDNLTSSLGVRAHYKPAEKVKLNADLGWQHLFGDKEPEARFAFTGGNDFTIEGAPMDRDSLGLGLDMDVTVRENLSIRAGYVGRFGEDTDSHAGFVSLEFSF